MPSFKPKTNKKIKLSKRNATTLDGTHKEIVNEFMRDEYDNIPKLKEEKAQLIQQITDQNSDLSIEQAMEIKDRLKEIKNTINELKIRKNNYFLDNSKYIFEYFENTLSGVSLQSPGNSFISFDFFCA